MDEIQGKGPNGRLTAEAQAYIVSNYVSMTDDEIAKQLCVDRSTVIRFRTKRNLRKHSTTYENAFGDITEDKLVTGEDSILVPEPKIMTPPLPPPSSGMETTPPPPPPPPQQTGLPSPPILSEEVEDQPIPELPRNTKPRRVKNESPFEKDKIALKKFMGKDLDKLIPSKLMEGFENQDRYLDKFVILQRGFTSEEWREFILHWMRYMEEHKFDFNVAEDFDDLVGMIREIIIQQNIFDKNKENRKSNTFFQTYMKQYGDSVNRMKKFQSNLKLSRRTRKSEHDYDKNSLAEVIALFDNEETRKLMAQADKDDNVELLGYMDKIRKKMNEDLDGGEVTGQESALLMGMDTEKVAGIVQDGVDILEEKVPENI